MSQQGRLDDGGGGSSGIETITGNIGGAVPPDGAGNINVVGSSPYTVSGNPGTFTLTISDDGTIATQYDTDSGTAVPSGGVLDIVGAHGINTTGATNVVTAQIDNAIFLGDLAPIATGSPALTLTTGDLDVISGNIEMPATAAAGADGVYYVASNRFMHSYGNFSTFVGTNAGNFTHTADRSTALGYNALTAVTSGFNNTAVGTTSLLRCNSGIQNVALGVDAGQNITNGSYCVAIGPAAQGNNATGFYNIAVGFAALNNSTNGFNIGIGVNAGAGVTGQKTIAIGYNTQTAANATDSNISVGHLALQVNQTAGNTAIGEVSLGALATGTGQNTCLGFQTFDSITTGQRNIGIGYQTGAACTTSDSSNIMIANVGVAGDNNTIRIGTQGSGSGQQDSCFIAGIAGVTVSNKNHVTIDTTTGEMGSELGVTSGGSSTDHALARWNGTGGDTLQDSTVIVTDNGEMTNASQPAFNAYLGTGDSNVTGNGTTYTLGQGNALTERFDQNADFNPGGSGTATFTAPVTGKYFLEFAARVNSTSGATDWTQNMNTSNFTYTLRTVPPTSTSIMADMSALADMDAADTCTYTIVVTGVGADTADIIATQTRVSGNLVC